MKSLFYSADTVFLNTDKLAPDAGEEQLARVEVMIG
jgi:hypothetical protein